MIINFLFLLSVLLFFHFLADYPLQGDFMAKAKNPTQPVPHVPWQYPMSAHAFIQAGFVFAVTGFWLLFVAEFICHFAIDYEKCKGEITFARDQWYHIGCKAVWAAIVVVFSAYQ